MLRAPLNENAALQALAVAAFVTVGLVLALTQVRGVWSGASLDRFRRILPIWPYSEAFREGWIRAMPTGVGGALFGMGPLILVVADRLGVEQPAMSWFIELGLVGFAGATLAVGAMASIVAFNVPKALVPPPLRQQPGLLDRSSWFARLLTAVCIAAVVGFGIWFGYVAWIERPGG